VTRPILYISGPYSAGNGRTVAENIAVARSYAVAAARKGWMPFTPHLNTAHFEVDCPEIPHSAWLAGDLAILRLLPRARAAVLLLPGWEQSKGARLERDWAIHLNLEVFRSWCRSPGSLTSPRTDDARSWSPGGTGGMYRAHSATSSRGSGSGARRQIGR
jgi:hypothetical protein